MTVILALRAICDGVFLIVHSGELSECGQHLSLVIHPVSSSRAGSMLGWIRWVDISKRWTLVSAW